jgi:hypothetical protein
MADSAVIEIADPLEFGEHFSVYSWQITDSTGRSLGPVIFSYNVASPAHSVPTINLLDPTAGSPGTEVTASGFGWSGGEVKVLWDDGTELKTTTVNDNGGFTVSFTVPKNTVRGQHTVNFVGVPPDGDSVPATFTVLAFADTQPPTLSWVKPVSNHGFYTTTSGTVELEVTASDNVNVRSVAFVRWDRVNLQWIGIDTDLGSNTDLSPPYQASVEVNTLSMGWNDTFAVVEDTAGNQTPVPIVISRAESKYALQFYMDTYYGPGKYCFSDSEGNGNLCPELNEQLSSILLKPGWSVQLFKDPNQGGTSKCFTTSDNDLTNDQFDDGTPLNDQVSSFSLYHQSSCGSTR